MAKLMGLEALPDSATTNQKQEMGVTPISPPFCAVASKVLTLFKSSHKQHNHDEAISADRGSVPSRPPSVVAKLMGLEALPDSATTNQKQEMGVTPISPPFYAVTSKVNASMRTIPFTLAKSESSRRCLSGYSDHPNYMSHTESSRAKLRSLSAPGGRRRSKDSNVKQNDDQHREAVGEQKKASYRGTQVSREVVMVPEFSEEIDNKQSPSSIQEKSSFLLREDESHDPEYSGPIFVLDDGIYMDDSPSPVKHIQKTLKDQWEMPHDVIPNTLSFGVSSEINHKKLQNIKHLLQKPTRLNSTHNIPNLQIKSYTIKKKEDASLHEEDDGLKTILWEEVLNRAESWTDYDGELPVIALELERLIFEDLVNEVVLVEASHGKRIQPGRCRRRLSSK
ncbi:longifolia 1-like protein [Tanacetum coccineum]